MTTTIAVENCASCPFSFDPNSDCDCQLWTCTAKETQSGYREIPRRRTHGNPPAWCPLRKSGQLVTLRVK